MDVSSFIDNYFTKLGLCNSVSVVTWLWFAQRGFNSWYRRDFFLYYCM